MVLTVLAEKLKADGKWGINISDSEGQFLSLLVRLVQPKKIVEIGTQYGYSTQWLMKNLAAHSYLWTLENNPQHAAVAKEYLSEFQNAEVILGDAIKSLEQVSQQAPVDLIFIDADKSSYPLYLGWAAKNLRSGGLLIADNTFVWGAAFDEEFDSKKKASKTQWSKMREFNQTLANSELFDSIILPTAEGLTVAIKL